MMMHCFYENKLKLKIEKIENVEHYLYSAPWLEKLRLRTAQTGPIPAKTYAKKYNSLWFIVDPNILIIFTIC